jgi:hypothetical protein
MTSSPSGDYGGRDADIGADTAGGHDPDLSAPSSRPQAGDLNVTGDGSADRSADPELPTDDPSSDVDDMDLPSGTPDDLQLGKRRTVAADEDAGAGKRDTSDL